jgi:hypothetical protein
MGSLVLTLSPARGCTNTHKHLIARTALRRILWIGVRRIRRVPWTSIGDLGSRKRLSLLGSYSLSVPSSPPLDSGCIIYPGLPGDYLIVAYSLLVGYCTGMDLSLDDLGMGSRLSLRHRLLMLESLGMTDTPTGVHGARRGRGLGGCVVGAPTAPSEHQGPEY